MAMAALGRPCTRLRELVGHNAFWHKNGELLTPHELDLLKHTMGSIQRELTTNESEFGFAGEPQKERKARIRFYREQHLKKSHHKNLCLSGGVFLNCVVTGQVREWFPLLKQVFIPPVPYDAGICLGMAQAAVHNETIDQDTGCR